MNADKFFETHSIEEISKKTKISPISLRFIRNREFEKLPRVKFIGFINILQKTYKVDLKDLIEEYNQFNPPENISVQEIETKSSKNSTFFLSIAAFVLLLLGGYLFYSYMKKNNSNQIKYTQNNSFQENNLTQNRNENNKTRQNSIQNYNSISQTANEVNTSKKIVSKNIQISYNKNNVSKKATIFKIDIIPNEKLWFKATNIDTNETIEYLTNLPKTLPKGNYYIKFGHGNLTIIYNDQNITPDTKKIVRILFKDGNYTYMKKPNRYEK